MTAINFFLELSCHPVRLFINRLPLRHYRKSNKEVNEAERWSNERPVQEMESIVRELQERRVNNCSRTVKPIPETYNSCQLLSFSFLDSCMFLEIYSRANKKMTITARDLNRNMLSSFFSSCWRLPARTKRWIPWPRLTSKIREKKT